MRREHKKKLTINRRIIVNHLADLEGVLDYLIAKQIFTPSIRERIIYESKVPTDRIRHTLDILVTRNALAYQYFLEALCLTGNTQLANILEPDYTSSEQYAIVMEREKIPKHLTDQSNLPFPVVCTQSHADNDNPDTNNQLQLTSSIIHRLLRQTTADQLINVNSSNFPSRSTSSGHSTSSSMSPNMNRVRSSSVTALRMHHRPLSRYETESSDSRFNSPCRSTQNFDLSSPIAEQHPPPPSTYTNIDWNDVNNLDLDFQVYKTLPNLRKQLAPDECYQMEQVPRGLCLIINNEHFYDLNGLELSNMRRYGTDMDASRLKNMFEKLNFQVEMFVDLKEIEMRQVIQSFANKCDYNSNLYDAICLIVLSHGTDGYIYGVDFENRLNMDKDILNTFDDILIGKPKLFIFQACRGEHLNQKDLSMQSNIATLTHSITTPSLSSSMSSTQFACTATSSKSFCGSSLNSTKKTTPLEEETIKKFKNLKMSSLASGTLQMMYKKKNSNSNTASCVSNPTSNQSSNQQVRVSKKTRSRSHSRSKYSSYLVSAASALRTAIKTSPSSTKTILTSISTQTTSSSINEQYPTQNACCYLNSNIITASTNQLFSNFIDGRPIKTSLPSRSDFFIWYSSVRGFVSHRDIDGSPFIKCLVTVFSRCAYELELIEMVRKVNLLMQQYEKKHFDERNAVASYFMVPVAEFHLTKRLYFNP